MEGDCSPARVDKLTSMAGACRESAQQAAEVFEMPTGDARG